jgi:hypothetical protein
MTEKPDDSPTLGELMNRGLYLDPGFNPDKPVLAKALHEEIKDTTVRAQANVDQQRQNANNIELITKDMEREAQRNAAEAGTPAESPDEK